MEQHHLDNALKKFEREKENGSPIPTNVYNALLAEQQRRRGPTAGATTTAVPATPAVEITPTNNVAPTVAAVDAAAKAMASVDFGNLAASLATVNQRLTAGLLQQNLDPQLIQQLADVINGVVNCTGGSGLREEAGVITTDTRLDTLPTEAYPHLTAKLITNSLRGYGVQTVGQLALLAPCDFGAVRFSTAEAYADASRLLASVGLGWNKASSILINDGYINRILNPNASAINTFIGEATARLTRASNGLGVAHSRAASLKEVERIFNGIKRRLGLAASVLGTSLLARGITAATAQTVLGPQIHLSVPFRNQVKLYLDRVSTRAALVADSTTEPIPA
jgi:hypothetical protein